MDAHGVRPSEDRQRHFTTPGDAPKTTIHPAHDRQGVLSLPARAS
jgi:hypothetical protein